MKAEILIKTICLLFITITLFSCSKKTESILQEQTFQPVIKEKDELPVAVATEADFEFEIEEPDEYVLETLKTIEDVFELEEEIIFDSSESSIIPTDGTYFDDIRHYSNLKPIQSVLNNAPMPVFMLNPKSNVKVRHVYYYDYEKRLQDGSKNVSFDATDFVDPVIICFFDNRTYQGYVEYYEELDGSITVNGSGSMGLPKNYENLKENPENINFVTFRTPFDFDNLAKWTKTDDGYEMILPPEKYQKEWNSYRLNKLKITSDKITVTYQNIEDLETMLLDDRENLVSQYSFDGDTITYIYHGYRSLNHLDEKLIFKKGILTEACENESYEDEKGNKWIRDRHYLYSCIEGEGTYEMYENGTLVDKGKLIRKLDEDGFMKWQQIIYNDGSAHEFTFSPTSIQKK